RKLVPESATRRMRRRCRSRYANVTVSIAACSGHSPRLQTATARRIGRFTTRQLDGKPSRFSHPLAVSLSIYPPSIEEIAVGHRQYRGRLAGQVHAVCSYLVGLGIDLDMRHRGVVDHEALVDRPDAVRRQHCALQPELLVDPEFDGNAGQKGDGGSRE